MAANPFLVAARRFAPLAPKEQRPFQRPGQLAHQLTRGRELQAAHLDLIDDIYMRIAAGELVRAIVTMPPRRGKSRRAARWGPLAYLLHAPTRRVAVASYGAELADEHGRWVRDQIEGHPELGITLSRSSKAANRWHIAGTDEGGMITLGVGGPFTGRGADLLVVDDPHKDRAEADSPTMRRHVWEWWTNVALTRLEPGGSVIIIQTRWHEDDLAGRLLATEPGRWLHLNLPELAEENDLLGRPLGAPLWPERFDLAADEETRAAVGSRVWTALYQQRPAPVEGAVFRWPWIETARVPSDACPLLRQTVVAVDPPASATGAECGIVAAGVLGDSVFVFADRSQQGTPLEWATAAWQTFLDAEASHVVVEDNQGGDMTVATLQSAWREFQPNRPCPPVRKVRARVGKRLRAEPVAALYETGRVHHVGQLPLLEDQLTGWVGTGDSPDRLDALVYAVTELVGSGPQPARVTRVADVRLPSVGARGF